MNQHHAMPALLFGLFTLEGERRLLLRPNQDGQLIETRLSEAECHILTHLLLRRSRYYADIIKSNASQGKYLNGWFNRLDALATACLEVLDDGNLDVVAFPRS